MQVFELVDTCVRNIFIRIVHDCSALKILNLYYPVLKTEASPAQRTKLIVEESINGPEKKTLQPEGMRCLIS